MTQFVIKNIPNNFSGNEAARRLSVGHKSYKRGRGPRPSSRYYVSLPLAMAERFTLYVGEGSYPKVYASLDLFQTIKRCKPHLRLEL